MEVSIIIVNYNTIKYIRNTILSIIEKTTNITYEIIVIDNNSNDDIYDLKSLQIPNLKLIKSKENLGFGKANNKASEHAKGKKLFFLNPDTILLNNAIKILSDYLNQNKNTGLVGSNLYSHDLKPNLSYEMIYPSIFMDISGAIKNTSNISFTKLLYGKNDIFNYKETPKEVAYITGANIMIWESIYNNLNGFDSRFFMYCEDADLSYRVKKLNYKIKNIPQAKIVHLEGKSIDFKEQRKKLFYEGRQVFYRLHYSKCYYFIANLIIVSFLIIAITINLFNANKRNRYIRQLNIFNQINFNNNPIPKK